MGDNLPEARAVLAGPLKIAEKAAGVVTAVSEVAEEFTPLGQIVHATTGAFALWWAFMVEVSEVQQGENYFPIKASLVQALIGIFGLMLIVLVALGVVVNSASKSSNFQFDKPNFAEQFTTYVLMFQKHISTLIAIGGLFACGFGKDFYSDEQGIAFVLTTLAFVSRLIIDKNMRIMAPTLLDESDGTRMTWAGPFMLFNIGIFVYNEVNDNGFNAPDDDDEHVWKVSIQVALIVSFLGALYTWYYGPGKADKKKNIELNGGEAAVKGALLFLLVASTAVVGTSPTEVAIISFMGVFVLDLLHVNYSEAGNNKLKGKQCVAFTSRLLHVIVGIATLVLIYLGMGETEDWASEINRPDDSSYDGDLTGSLNRTAEENYNIELPAAAKIMRDVAYVSGISKIILLFYMVNFSYKKGVSANPLGRFTSENTLRQISTIGLLVSSSFVWAYPIVKVQEDALAEDATKKRDEELLRLGVGLFVLAVLARVVDAVTDYYIHSYTGDKQESAYGVQGTFWDYFAWMNKPEDRAGESSLEKASWDNPRSWLVIAGIATSLALLSEIAEFDTFDDNSDDWDHKETTKFLSFLFLMVHLVVAAWQIFALALINQKSSDTEGNKNYYTLLSLSRSPFIRLIVTTFTITVLTMLLSEMKFGETPASMKADQYGLLKNKVQYQQKNENELVENGNVITHTDGNQYAQVNVTEKTVMVSDVLTVSTDQWYALGAVFSYIVADLVGHVFL